MFPTKESLQPQLQHVKKITKELLAAGHSRSKLGKKRPTVAAIQHSSAAPIVASTGPSEASNVTFFPKQSAALMQSQSTNCQG